MGLLGKLCGGLFLKTCPFLLLQTVVSPAKPLRLLQQSTLSESSLLTLCQTMAILEPILDRLHRVSEGCCPIFLREKEIACS